MKARAWLAVALLLSAHELLAQTPAPVPSPAAPAQKPCELAEKQQFAFWAGDWTVEWQTAEGQKLQGTNHVEWVLDGCVLQENFNDPSQEYSGKSWSVYDAVAKRWKQTWVDNSGAYLDFVGGFEDGKMRLEREATLADGQKARQRMTFYNIAADAMDWDWETSKDGGQTWKLAWRIHYSRAQASK